MKYILALAAAIALPSLNVFRHSAPEYKVRLSPQGNPEFRKGRCIFYGGIADPLPTVRMGKVTGNVVECCVESGSGSLQPNPEKYNIIVEYFANLLSGHSA